MRTIVAEGDCVEINIAHDRRQADGAARVAVFRSFFQDFVRTFEASQRLCNLRADLNDLHDGRDEEAHKQRVGKKSANRQRPGQNLLRADIHDDRSHHAQQHARRKPHDGTRGQRAHDVVEQPHYAQRKDLFLAILGVIALDDPHASKRFRQTPSNLGGDFAAIAEDRTDRLKRFFQSEPETKQEAERQHCHQRADTEEHHQSDRGREQSPGKIDQAGTDQVAHAFHVGHDARYQNSALGRIMKCDRQPPDMSLHLLPKLGDQALGGLGEQLREREGSNPLNKSRQQYSKHERLEQVNVAFDDDAIDQVSGGIRRARGRPRG